MIELQKSLPRLDVWDTIYPTDSMTILVADVYREVTIFAREALLYFTKFSSQYLQQPMAIKNSEDHCVDQYQHNYVWQSVVLLLLVSTRQLPSAQNPCGV
jgi:hypothetical protein